MKKLIIVTVILLAGIGLLAYPSVSNYFAQKNGSTVMSTYTDTVAGLTPDQLDAEWQAAEQYNESITGSPVHDPFLDGSGMAMPEDYMRVLNVAGLIGTLDIPRIGVNLPIYHGTNDWVLRHGVGHLEGSTLPIGGTSRHTVVSGHTGLTNAKLLTDLVALADGDMFYFHVLGRTLAYRVDQVKIIEPYVTDDLKSVEGKDYATLLTCTPYGVNSHRLLVRGERVEYDPNTQASIKPIKDSEIDAAVRRAALITAGVMAGLILVVAVVRRRREKDASRTAGSR